MVGARKVRQRANAGSHGGRRFASWTVWWTVWCIILEVVLSQAHEDRSTPVMTPKRNATFKFTEEQLAEIAKLSERMGVPQVAVIRRGLFELSRTRLDIQLFLSDFKRKYGAENYLVVELDEKFDAFALINGERVDDIYVPAQAIRFEDGSEFMEVFLADSSRGSSPGPGPFGGRARLSLGLLPLRTRVPLKVAIEDLDVDMQPPGAAWWVNG